MRAHELYMNSASNWIPQVPAHWTISPLGSHFVERKETVSDADFPPLSVTKLGVVPQLHTAAKSDNNESRKLVRAGDFAINSRSDRKGSSGISNLDGSVSVVYTVLEPQATVDRRFVHHLFRSSAFQEEFYRWGSGIVADLWSTRYSAMKHIPLAVPPLVEQRSIADFLDRETSRIDTLITEQVRLIDLLTERRQAIISTHTSNVDWHSIQLVRCLTSQVDYRGATPTKQDRGIQLITAKNVKKGWIDYDSSKEYIDPKTYADVMRRGLPERGDLLFTMEAPLGNVALVDSTYIALAQRIIKWRLNAAIAFPRFIMYAILSDKFQFQLQQLSTGSTALGIKASKLSQLRIQLPELAEQERRVALIDEQTSKLDTLIAEVEKFIELSRERRAALITAAVTGQIDVREEVA